MRFSSPKQADGDSIRRQEVAALDWCARNGVGLDEKTTFRDLGRSAYLGEHRKNPERHALAAFLRLVEEGRVARGSYLILENLDRLTREHIRPALTLLLNLIEWGVRVVQLKPVETIFDENVDPMQLMMAIMELSRGNSESRMKSERMSAVWGQKQAEARRTGQMVTNRLPAWLEKRDGRIVVVPDRVKIVTSMFRWCLDGLGLSLIVKRLTESGIPIFGRGRHWNKANIHKTLTSRAVLGEYQPQKGRKPAGPPIIHYYPSIIEEDQWQLVQAALKRRKHRPGPTGKNVPNLFSGLVRDARTQSKMAIAWQTCGRKGQRTHRRVLVPAASLHGATKTISFPNSEFEQAILSMLRELRPQDVLIEESPGESTALAASLVRTESSIESIVGEMEQHGESPALFKRLRQKEAEQQALAVTLAEARLREQNPKSAAFAEMVTLMDIATSEQHRLRLRELLRTLIEEVWVLIVPRRSHRLCAIQIFFNGGGQRDFLVHYQSSAGHRQGFWHVNSWKHNIAGPLDLRDRDHVDALRKLLVSVDLTLLAESMA
jgi:DNA invertase Pin-like site-specific DNA recombinase